MCGFKPPSGRGFFTVTIRNQYNPALLASATEKGALLWSALRDSTSQDTSRLQWPKNIREKRS